MNKLLHSIFYTPKYLTPAYGRNYGTAAAAMRDWRRGRDFMSPQGGYFSIADYDELAIDGPVYIVITKNQQVKVEGICNKSQ